MKMLPISAAVRHLWYYRDGEKSIRIVSFASPNRIVLFLANRPIANVNTDSQLRSVVEFGPFFVWNAKQQKMTGEEVKAKGLHFAIEQCFRICKSGIGETFGRHIITWNELRKNSPVRASGSSAPFRGRMS